MLKKKKSQKAMTHSGVATDGSRQLMKKKLAVTILAVIVMIGISIIAYAWYSSEQKDNVAIKVAEYSYTFDEYDQLYKEYEQENIPSNLDKQKFAEYIVDTFKTRAVADRVGIAVTQNEINDTAQTVFNDNDGQYNNMQMLVAENTAYKKKIEQLKTTDKRVARFVFPFSRHFASGQEQLPENFGSLNTIEADMEYANQKANEIKSLIEKDSSEQNVIQNIESILVDERLTYGHTGNRSAVFNYDQDLGKAYLSLNESRELSDTEQGQINELASGVSDIFTEKQDRYYAAVKEYSYDGVANSYYFFVVLPSGQMNDLQQTIKAEKDKVKVVQNV